MIINYKEIILQTHNYRMINNCQMHFDSELNDLMWLFKPSKVSLSLTSSGHVKKKVGTAVRTLYSRPPPDALALTRSLNLSGLC